MKIVNTVLISLILLFGIIFSFVIINSLQFIINSMPAQVSVPQYDFDTAQLENNIREMLTEQSGIISDYSITYKNPNSQTAMIDIAISVTPKEYTNDTKAIFYLNNTTKSDLIRSGNSFVGTISVPISKLFNSPSVSFENSDVTTTQTLKNEWIECASLFQSNFYVQEHYSNHSITNNLLSVDSEIGITYNSHFNSNIVSAKINILADNEKVWSDNISNLKANEETIIPLNQTINVNNDSTIKLLVEIVDSLGFTYANQIILISNVEFLSPTAEWSEWYDDYCKVYDKNGKEIIFDQE